MAPLEALQSWLERLYEVRIEQRVGDFVITDPALALELGGESAARDTPEQLLVQQEKDTLALALYLDAELLDRLAGHDPNLPLQGERIADYCTALEGVSHFLYLSWHAGHDREVTALEMELQAEVDKFIGSAWQLQPHDPHAPRQLHRWLFDTAAFATDLSRDELERYRDASQYAGQYCRQLTDCYMQPQQAPATAMLNELRRFYRLPLHHKLRRIERMN